MSSKDNIYKVSLSGKKVTVNEQSITEAVALRILTVIMGGTQDAVEDRVSNSVPARNTIREPSELEPTPKAFMTKKKPQSGVERVTCLAHYLTVFRKTTVFKTIDLTKLNTEAAQPRLSNAAVFLRHAVNAGYLATAGSGKKQITSLGEAVANSLPDRAAVETSIQEFSIRKRPKRRKRSTQKKK
jgi:hypothetical protein